MPIIRIEMLEGRSDAQKRACAETCNGRPEAVQVIFTDVAKFDWATGGQLMSDALK